MEKWRRGLRVLQEWLEEWARRCWDGGSYVSTKLTVVNAAMMPSLSYSCEVWSLTKQQQRRVQATQMSMMRRIQGVSRLDKMRSKEIRQWLGQEDILDVIRRRQENWKCKLDDMNSERTTKKVHVGVMKGGWPRGRPMMRSIDNFKLIICILVTSVLCRDL